MCNLKEFSGEREIENRGKGRLQQGRQEEKKVRNDREAERVQMHQRRKVERERKRTAENHVPKRQDR